MLSTFIYRGKIFNRVTIKFMGGPAAAQARAFVHDVLIRAHGFATATRLTKKLAEAGGQFRTAVAKAKIKILKRRLRLLVDAGLIKLFVAGKLV